MTDVPVVKPPRPIPEIPKYEHDDEEKKVRTPVSVSSRIVADGSTRHRDVEYARMTLVMRPSAKVARLGAEPPPEDATVNFRCWPSEVMKKHFTPYDTHRMRTKVRVVAATGLSGKDDAAGLDKLAERAKLVDAEVMWNSDQQVTDRIDRFWRRMMNPPPRLDKTRTVWERMVQALMCESNEKISVILPTPQGAAALAFTLERGRLVLDAVAGPNSPLAARGPLQQVANLARPWYQDKRRTQVASLTPDIAIPAWGQSPEDEEYWIAPYRKRTAALLAGERPHPIWPRAQTFADAALAGGSAAADLMERIHAAHHITTPANPAYPVCSTEDQALDTARRRLGALLSLPTLQRLFGFAVDLLIDDKSFRSEIQKLRQEMATDTPFILLAPEGDGASWTLARYESDDKRTRPVFCPASWNETQAQPTATAFGLRNLGDRDSGGNPRYDIITVDPALATEGNINHAAKGDAKGSALSPAEGGVPVLHNGGLRVIEFTDSLRQLQTNKSACEPQLAVQDAEDIKNGDRLMIGVKAHDGLIWRSPDYRVIRFEDPSNDVPPDWVEKELAHRLYPADPRRRLELDGGMSMPAVQLLVDNVSVTDSDTDSDKDPVLKSAIKVIADCTVALWGSDPAGVPPPGHDRNGKTITKTKVAVVEELDVTRHFSAPSRDCQYPADMLSPSLRFGWPYYTVLAHVFEGGSCATTRQIGEIADRKPSVALPRTDQSGRRFLRHERLNAPMSLILDGDVRELNGIKPPQRSGDMYVRTMANTKLNVSRSRRLIAPPPVPLQFAMLHDVLRNLGPKVAAPRQGLSGLSLLGHHRDPLPSRVRVGDADLSERTGSLYYPDPAASILVLGLKLPQEKGVEIARSVEQPVAIPVGARTWPDADSRPALRNWPDVIPLHIELKAVEAPKAVGKTPEEPRVVPLGLRWLTAKERLVSKPEHGAVQVQAVEVNLRGGEDLLLQAWCVPTTKQLADWFDAIEAAGVLALNHSPFKGDPDSACIKGLEPLLDTQLPVLDRHYAAVAACVGAGGLRAPSRQTILTLAGLVHRELLVRPISALASPLTTRLTHAIDDCLIPAPMMGPRLAVTRRVFSGGAPASQSMPAPEAGAQAPGGEAKTPDPAKDGETPADFLNNTPISDWGLSSTQEGATSVLFGGDISFDPASTGGLIIEAHCAAPFGEALDPETGRTQVQRFANDWKAIVPGTAKPFGFKIGSDRRVDFERKNVTVLKLEGLSLPADGRAGMRSYSLEALMSGAWGAKRQFGDALRAALPGAFNGSGAQRLWLRAVPINRHSGLLPSPPKQVAVNANLAKAAKDKKAKPDPIEKEIEEWDPPEPFDIWLPATTRPLPPVIDHVSVALSLTPLPTLTGLDGAFTVGIQQSSILTIWQARPFLSSGEGEMIALVLWPPGLFARGVDSDEKGKALFPRDSVTSEPPEFFDEDLGPGGAYVTRWGADPLTGDHVPAAQFPTGPLVDPSRLSEDGLRVPRAFMPIPVAGESWVPAEAPGDKDSASGQPSTAVKTPVNAPNTYLAVALHAFEPRFDPMEELWYVNVALRTDPLAFPRVRLGLVRYQPNAREDDAPLEGSEPVRLRVSTPVMEWVKPLPGRTATATCRPRADGRTEIVVVVDGPSADPDENKKGIRARMVVELIRHTTSDGLAQEETAKESDGGPAICSNWSTEEFDSAARGLMRRLPGGCSWTCLFVLPGPLEDSTWSHSVVVRESREIKRALKSDEPTDSTGPNFVARIPLTDKISGIPLTARF